jgi:reductive dehalogenase
MVQKSEQVWGEIRGVAGRSFSTATGQLPQRDFSIRHVDHPALGKTTAEFERFSGDDMFALYPKLKTARDGEGAFEKEIASNGERAARWMREARPGFQLRDRQLSEAAGKTVMYNTKPGEGLLSWTRLAVRTPAEMGVPAYSASPLEAANTVKAAARLYGAALVGIAPMKERYVSQRVQGKAVLFEDVDVPVVTPEKLVIPRKMKWVVVVVIPTDLDLLARVPSAIGDVACGLAHSQLAFTGATLAEFIRGLGYQAIPSVNETAQFVPFAMDAGLGELSRMNTLVTPEFGAAIRLCTVFTDLPMACDKPVTFGMVDACKQCKACAEACPAGALSFDAEPSLRVSGAWNNPGHEAWFGDSFRCFEYWQASGTACAACVTSCPFTKAAAARRDRRDPRSDGGRPVVEPWWVASSSRRQAIGR